MNPFDRAAAGQSLEDHCLRSPAVPETAWTPSARFAAFRAGQSLVRRCLDTLRVPRRWRDVRRGGGRALGAPFPGPRIHPLRTTCLRRIRESMHERVAGPCATGNLHGPRVPQAHETRRARVFYGVFSCVSLWPRGRHQRIAGWRSTASTSCRCTASDYGPRDGSDFDAWAKALHAQVDRADGPIVLQTFRACSVLCSTPSRFGTATPWRATHRRDRRGEQHVWRAAQPCGGARRSTAHPAGD